MYLRILEVKRMTKYQEEIKELRAKIHQKQEKILELQQKEKALLSGLTEICPSCKGKKTERYCDAAGSMDTRKCKTCKGYGYVGQIKCECGNVIPVDMIHLRRLSFPECPWCGRRLEVFYL